MLKRWVPPPIKRGIRWLADTDFRRRVREVRRLRTVPRYSPVETDLVDGIPLRLVDAASFLSAYRGIFQREIYAFEHKGTAPRIIDCGANIGLAVLYWKKQFPEARITAFEPDPDVFEALEWNCNQFGCEVELIRQGVWKYSGEVAFWQEGADGGHIIDEAASAPDDRVTTVSVLRLKDYLEEHVDLLKLDIEGAETEVLLDCEDALHRVEHLFVEYHSFNGQDQRLDEVFGVLRRNGFRIHVQPELVSSQPFLEQLDNHGMDQRLNIFAYRQ